MPCSIQMKNYQSLLSLYLFIQRDEKLVSTCEEYLVIDNHNGALHMMMMIRPCKLPKKGCSHMQGLSELLYS